MLSVETPAPVAGSGEFESSFTSKCRTYLLALLGPIILISILAIPVSFAIARSNWYVGGGLSAFVDAPFSLHDQDNQVIIVGDSTGELGVKPSVLTQKTGLNAWNLAVDEPQLAVSGFLILDNYLAKNKRPRFVVLHVSPWYLGPLSWPKEAFAEAYLAELRHGSRRGDLALLMHPSQTIEFAIHVLQDGGKRLLRRGSNPDVELTSDWMKNRGYTEAIGPPLTTCSVTHLLDRPNRRWLDAFRDKYERDGTQVIIFASAVPDCEPNYPYYSQVAGPVIDNRVQALPRGLFVADGYEDHLLSAGADRESEELGALINSKKTAATNQN